MNILHHILGIKRWVKVNIYGIRKPDSLHSNASNDIYELNNDVYMQGTFTDNEGNVIPFGENSVVSLRHDTQYTTGITAYYLPQSRVQNNPIIDSLLYPTSFKTNINKYVEYNTVNYLTSKHYDNYNNWVEDEEIDIFIHCIGESTIKIILRDANTTRILDSAVQLTVNILNSSDSIIVSNVVIPNKGTIDLVNLHNEYSLSDVIIKLQIVSIGSVNSWPEEYYYVNSPIQTITYNTSTHVISVSSASGNNASTGIKAFGAGGTPINWALDREAPSLSMTVTVVSSPSANNEYNWGETVTYRTILSNNGNVALNNISAYDLIGGMNATGINLAPGATQVINQNYVIEDSQILAGSITNGVTASCTHRSGNQNVYVNANINNIADPSGHLNISIVTTSEATGVGYNLQDNIEYDVIILNDGNLTISNIVLECDMTGDCWQVGNLTPGQYRPFTASYHVIEEDILTGEVIVIATATGDSPDLEHPDVPVTPGENSEPTVNPINLIYLECTELSTMPANGYNINDQISLQVYVRSDSNITLTNCTLSGGLPFIINRQIDSCGPDYDGNFNYTYTVTENDIKRGYIYDNNNPTNITFSGTTPDTSYSGYPTYSISANLPQFTLKPINPAIAIQILPTNSPANGVFYDDTETIIYKIVTTNIGNITLNNVQVTYGGLVVATIPSMSPGDVQDSSTVQGGLININVNSTDINNQSHTETVSVTAQSDETTPQTVTANNTNTVLCDSYMYIYATQAGSHTITIPDAITTSNLSYIEYSKDKTNWTRITNVNSTEVSNTITVNQWDKVYLRGSGTRLGGSVSSATEPVVTNHTHISSTSNFDVEGNIMSLLYPSPSTFYNQTTLPGVNTFVSLFAGNTYLHNATFLTLPATTLTNHCYNSMFNGCTSLIGSPTLPATSVTDYAYARMFKGCTALNACPTLPATTAAQYCYYYMFYGCTTLTQTCELPATSLNTFCYGSMFEECSNLISGPTVLPALTCGSQVYRRMFAKCTSLVNAPEIACTTLTSGYNFYYMFVDCRSLVNAPSILKPTTLTGRCYAHMFDGCSALVNAPQIMGQTTAVECCGYMFIYCSNLITAPILYAAVLSEDCYYYMFRQCSKLTSLECHATDISATDCTYGWVYGITTTGTFYCKASADMSPNDWTQNTVTNTATGTTGIPKNWTRQTIVA